MLYRVTEGINAEQEQTGKRCFSLGILLKRISVPRRRSFESRTPSKAFRDSDREAEQDFEKEAAAAPPIV